MAVSLRSSAKAGNNSITTIVVNEPAGAQIGDWLVAVVAGNTDQTLSDANGGTPFTKDNQQNESVSGNTVAIFSRKKESGDPATWSFSGSAGNQRMSAIAMAFQDGDPSAAYDVVPTAATGDITNGPVSTFDCKDITTINDLAIHIAASCMDSAASTFNSFPPGYTAVETQDGTGQPISVYILVISPAGATGTKAFGTAGSVGWISQSFAIQDDQGAAPTPPKYIRRLTGYHV